MKSRILVFGEVLFDCFEDEKEMGGAPFNFAYHMHQLGHEVKFISSIGEDPLGKEIKHFMQTHGLNLKGLQKNPSHPTGQVQVKMMADGSHEFNIESPAAYDFIQFDKIPQELLTESFDLIYFGTLSQRNEVSSETLYQILSKVKSTHLLLDLNLRAPFFNENTIKKSLTACNMLKISDEEEAELKKSLYDKEDITSHLQSTFGISKLILTQGKNGSDYLTQSKERVKFREVKVGGDVIDTVGAGDAFTSMLAHSMLSGFSPLECLTKASHFAGEICLQRGALPSNNDFYTVFKDK